MCCHVLLNYLSIDVSFLLPSKGMQEMELITDPLNFLYYFYGLHVHSRDKSEAVTATLGKLCSVVKQ